jgi:hypothetical protein
VNAPSKAVTTASSMPKFPIAAIRPKPNMPHSSEVTGEHSKYDV